MKNTFIFLSLLRNGKFGLPKTYWLYGVLIKIVLVSLMILLMYSHPVISLFIYSVYLFYLPFLLMGIFKSACDYKNYIAWKYLAILTVCWGTVNYFQEWTLFKNTVEALKSFM